MSVLGARRGAGWTAWLAAAGVLLAAGLTWQLLSTTLGAPPELRVEINVPATVSMAGRTLGHGTDIGPITGLPPGRSVPLTIAADGYAPVVRQVEMSSGERRVLSVEMVQVARRMAGSVVAESASLEH